MSKKKTGKGLTTPGMLVEKMRKRGKRSSRRMRAAKGMVVAGSAAAGIGMRLPGLSIAGQGITLAACATAPKTDKAPKGNEDAGCKV